MRIGYADHIVAQYVHRVCPLVAMARGLARRFYLPHLLASFQRKLECFLTELHFCKKDSHLRARPSRSTVQLPSRA